MKKIYSGIIVLIAFSVFAVGVVKSGWTSTSDPATARAALGVGAASYYNPPQFDTNAAAQNEIKSGAHVTNLWTVPDGSGFSQRWFDTAGNLKAWVDTNGSLVLIVGAAFTNSGFSQFNGGAAFAGSASFATGNFAGNVAMGGSVNMSGVAGLSDGVLVVGSDGTVDSTAFSTLNVPFNGNIEMQNTDITGAGTVAATTVNATTVVASEIQGVCSGPTGTLTYATSINADLTKSIKKVTTVNAVGNATINTTSAGYAGGRYTFIIYNDATSAKSITFGTGFRSSGPISPASPSHAAVIEFVSDGTSLFEKSRATGL
jgi:hypothetical protein